MAEPKTKLYNEKRLKQGMDAARLDALVAVSPDNYFYLSSHYMWSAVHIRDRIAVAVLPRDGAPFLVVCANEVSNVRRYTWVDDVRLFTEFVDSPAEVLGAELASSGLGGGRIGIEKKYLTAHYYEQLARTIPSATLVAADDIFDRARMVKTPAEVELLRTAAFGTDKAIYTAMELAREGDTELDLVSLMANNLVRIGGGEFKNISWGAAGGENVLTTHYTGGQRPIRRGDQVRVNLRAAWGNYFSHLYRNAWVGEISARHADLYKRLRELYGATIKLMRPGIRACDVYERITKQATATGLSVKGAHVGHSTGILLHENPRLQPIETTELEAGMVIAVEPLAAEPGFGVYHIEDLVLVTDNDPVVLSDYTDTTEPFIIR